VVSAADPLRSISHTMNRNISGLELPAFFNPEDGGKLHCEQFSFLQYNDA
jgi:hypothetical protein